MFLESVLIFVGELAEPHKHLLVDEELALPPLQQVQQTTIKEEDEEKPGTEAYSSCHHPPGGERGMCKE